MSTQLLTLVSAVVGAVIATASAALLERQRWRQERGERAADMRRSLYGEYLAALADTRNGFRALGRDLGMPRAERAVAARKAMEPCYALRYQMSITASPPVYAASELAFRRLRLIRDSLAEGVVSGDDGYTEVRSSYQESLTALRGAMRRDLGTPAPDDPPAVSP
ncbi:hypothetical protein ACWDR0_10945 [Streptomyces sp. NPDC003691]